jgi:hypothetical protein
VVTICPVCDGTGRVHVLVQSPYDESVVAVPNGAECRTCDGNGWVMKPDIETYVVQQWEGTTVAFKNFCGRMQ